MIPDVTRYDVEIAYSFLHQKQRVYEFSTMLWQRDDIEYAIGDYVGQMNSELYKHIARGRARFLLDHNNFAQDIAEAVEQLEAMLSL